MTNGTLNVAKAAVVDAKQGTRNPLRLLPAGDWLGEQAAVVADCLEEMRVLAGRRADVQCRLSEVLRTVKEQTEHGAFAAFCADFHLSQRTVEVYLQVGRHPEARRLFSFGLGKAAVLASLSVEELERVLKIADINGLTAQELRDLVRDLKEKPCRRVPRTASPVDVNGTGRLMDIQTVWAAGALHLNPRTLTPIDVRHRYEVLRLLLANSHDHHGFLPSLEAAKAILDAALGTANAEPPTAPAALVLTH